MLTETSFDETAFDETAFDEAAFDETAFDETSFGECVAGEDGAIYEVPSFRRSSASTNSLSTALFLTRLPAGMRFD